MEPQEIPEDVLRPRVRVMQIIAAALLMGVLVFLGVALFLVQREGRGLNPPGELPYVSYFGLLYSAALLFAWALIPASLARRQVRHVAAGTWAPGPATVSPRAMTDAERLLAVYQTKNLVGWALLESIGFFGCLAYLLEAEPFALSFVASAVVLLLLSFPTRGRTLRWLEVQQSRVAEIRQSGEAGF